MAPLTGLDYGKRCSNSANAETQLSTQRRVEFVVELGFVDSVNTHIDCLNTLNSPSTNDGTRRVNPGVERVAHDGWGRRHNSAERIS